ncbi:hypothetical protein FRUB_09276 [Fimbriiglobus ruber]|uniref:Uncharacterized protein n=1 Tax=Fimbriiglobus ruber TaxID=1908690 RepID=A0A225D6V5_9BACT|nr:hypothetical protein FRUB_09276 [Fimbriiglobus ruber]
MNPNRTRGVEKEDGTHEGSGRMRERPARPVRRPSRRERGPPKR